MTQESTPERATTVYELIGGHDTFARLVHRFYAGIATDELLRPMYPEQDLGPAEDRLRMFLEQYWGGPHTYSEQRGHPRLRMRHVPYHIDEAARDRWLHHMRVALDELELAPEVHAVLWEYFERVAHFLVNAPSDETVAPAQAQELTITRVSRD